MNGSLLDRFMCLVGLLCWAFLPVAVVVALWQGDWRWAATGAVVALAGIPIAWLGVQGAKTRAKGAKA